MNFFFGFTFCSDIYAEVDVYDCIRHLLCVCICLRQNISTIRNTSNSFGLHALGLVIFKCQRIWR
jgi:hypothetical protein